MTVVAEYSVTMAGPREIALRPGASASRAMSAVEWARPSKTRGLCLAPFAHPARERLGKSPATPPSKPTSRARAASPVPLPCRDGRSHSAAGAAHGNRQQFRAERHIQFESLAAIANIHRRSRRGEPVQPSSRKSARACSSSAANAVRQFALRQLCCRGCVTHTTVRE